MSNILHGIGRININKKLNKNYEEISNILQDLILQSFSHIALNFFLILYIIATIQINKGRRLFVHFNING